MWLLAVAFFCVSFLFAHFLYNTRRDNILALMTLFLYQVGKRQKPFLLMHMGGVCVCMCTFAYVWHTTQLKMRYGQADGSELAGSLLLCMEEYSKQQHTLVLSALCTVSPALQHLWDCPQLPVVLTGTLAASFHISQLGKLLLKLWPIELKLHFLAR